tara:strand:- start:11760 stop:11939 length:180 start_codon:yes stop_codon:yes gene_type:complete
MRIGAFGNLSGIKTYSEDGKAILGYQAKDVEINQPVDKMGVQQMKSALRKSTILPTANP